VKYSVFAVRAQLASTLLSAAFFSATAQATMAGQVPQATAAPSESARLPNYVLGPDDVISIRALNAEEMRSDAVRIDPSGEISVPLLGRLRAAGLTIDRLETEVSERLKMYVHDPVVAVSIVEYRSQPVSVIGAVAAAGVHQLEGRKTLIEMLAKAGGLRPEAGNVVKITRKVEWGSIPHTSAAADASGKFIVAEVNLTEIIQATKPDDNILILPNDVISVPRANLVYVIGEVKRPGGFVIQERRAVSGLHALAMAEGLTDIASPQGAIIIRRLMDGERLEIAADLKGILNGTKSDVELLPDDILFVPTNVAKNVLRSSVQTALSAVTSALIYRGF
jgi:polysaccharide export outer membrane protein